MKRIIYKSSIIIPLAMVFYCFIEPFAFCVPEIGLYMETYSSRIMIVMVTVVWLCCSPFRRGTCNGTITELLCPASLCYCAIAYIDCGGRRNRTVTDAEKGRAEA